MMKSMFAAVAVALAAASIVAPAAAAGDPLDARTLIAVGARFEALMAAANRHDLAVLGGMYWRSPSALLVAKSAVPSEGNWAATWGNEAIERKLHDIAASGPVALQPDLARLKVVGLTREVAESYDPVTITVSYAGQDGTPRPFLVIIDWIRTGRDWKIASEILLPVPPAPKS
ncbi:MAG: hypothetical protein JF625_06805 [Inquilinus limosus]|uniref:DUF4440 domain-containing protein n=1 Tax=Inquilinus limosus TaxID=171674 RepID=A0A952KE13_9PROT|nr:hypothetical protein [Inquilinus limosus]